MTVRFTTTADTVLIHEEILKAERQIDRLTYATPKSLMHAETIRRQLVAERKHLGRLKEMLT